MSGGNDAASVLTDVMTAYHPCGDLLSGQRLGARRSRQRHHRCHRLAGLALRVSDGLRDRGSGRVGRRRPDAHRWRRRATDSARPGRTARGGRPVRGPQHGAARTRPGTFRHRGQRHQRTLGGRHGPTLTDRLVCRPHTLHGRCGLSRRRQGRRPSPAIGGGTSLSSAS